MQQRYVYKICGRQEWESAEADGRYRGSALDLKDGFIHFSSGAQAVETARLHFAGQSDLVLICVDAEALGEPLRWEPSRGGDLFPHLYGDLSLQAVRRVQDLPLDSQGIPAVPPLE